MILGSIYDQNHAAAMFCFDFAWILAVMYSHSMFMTLSLGQILTIAEAIFLLFFSPGPANWGVLLQITDCKKLFHPSWWPVSGPRQALNSLGQCLGPKTGWEGLRIGAKKRFWGAQDRFCGAQDRFFRALGRLWWAQGMLGRAHNRL